jgi:hypothetical protein
MKTTLVPALVLAGVVGVGSFGVKAEPLLLTSSQMEAVTAGLTLVLPDINVNAGNVDILQNLNLTNQTAVALGVALATCGVCSGNIPAAEAAAAAANAALAGQGIQQ